MNSVEKHLALVMEWVDRGFDKGVKKAKFDLDKLKKKARELARDIAIAAAAFTAFTLGLFKALEAGAKALDIADTFDTIREKAGLLPGVLNDIREATRGTVTDMKLMSASGQALTDGLDPTRLVDLWSKAKQISEVTNQDITQTFEMLYLAIAKGQTRMLTSIGITLDAEEVVRNYAAAIGKTTEQLTFKDRQLAISIALEEKYQRQFAALGELGGDNAEKFDRFKTAVVNLKDKFLMMLASSPSVERFLGFLLKKIENLDREMASWEPKIRAVVTQLMKFYEGLASFASEKAVPAIENIYKFRGAILSVGAALGTGLLASKIMGIGVALGLVTGGAATAISVLAGVLAGVGVATYEVTKKTNTLNQAMTSLAMSQSGGALGLSMAMRDVNEETKGTLGLLDQLIAKYSAYGMVYASSPGKAAAPAGAPGAGGAAAGERVYKELEQQELEPFARIYEQKIELAQAGEEQMRTIAFDRHQYELWLMQESINATMREAELRREIWMRTWSAMENYAARYSRGQVSMGRAVNAALVSGFYEMAAAYIDAKSQQAKIDVLEYGYQMLADIARGRFYTMGLWAKAIAGASAVAGSAMAASAYLRSEGTRRAEEMAGAGAFESEFGGAGGDTTGSIAQRKQVTGIVNTRPISIVVNSTAYFQSGYMIFGDSETAANDLYERIVRDKIEDDIESGMIQVA